MMTLNQLKPGQRAVIEKVGTASRLRLRLYELGMLPGTEFLLRKRAPFGDPLQIFLRGYTLTLRKSDAERIEVKRL